MIHDPVADPRAQVVAGATRFTLLSPRVVRIEWSPDGVFEDRASFAFVQRRQPVPPYRVERRRGVVTIQTESLRITFRETAAPPDESNLRIEFRVGNRAGAWKPGDSDAGNLRGTTRTLDEVSGACALEPGILSSDGWTLVDDSRRLLFDDSDWPWVTHRRQANAIDWMFFAFGADYPQALRDFAATAGRAPLPPRYVFGVWWSRYWAYSDAELRDLVAQFREHQTPLDVLIIDMDWHLDGWTGYTWNPKYFPDPEGFLRWTHDEGLRIGLNLHPADGVGKHEAAFEGFCRELNLDPAKHERVEFDCGDRRFIAAYFKHLHHPLERQGVDFWWMDWQQGAKCRIEGLDPLMWLNYLHWSDWEREPGAKRERPLIFSRWGGLGNHRYPIGFSGDTYCDWESLAFQPYFTATAGNVGYAYWSHDIGGHLPGPVEPELYARWIQWGALSPILRTHTTKHPDAERRIWAFPREVFEVSLDAFRLRRTLLPYIYTMSRKIYDAAMPLCRPLYYEWPNHEEAYARTDQYLFGDAFLAAPVTQPVDPASGVATVEIWFPPGRWVDWQTGVAHTGPAVKKLEYPLSRIPLFVRAGAVVPTCIATATCNDPIADLTLHIFCGANGGGTLYEDDGDSRGYERGEFAQTTFELRCDGRRARLTISPAIGDYPDQLRERELTAVFHNVRAPGGVKVDGASLTSDGGAAQWSYDSATRSCRVHLGKRATRATLAVELTLET